MLRIAGTTLPEHKRIEAALPYIYGIGPTSARKILDQAKVDSNRRAKDLSEEEISKITAIIQNNYVVEGDLRREVTQNVKRLMDIGAYRGMRHKKSLPARGQRTRNNPRTRKGRQTIVGKMMVKPAA